MEERENSRDRRNDRRGRGGGRGQQGERERRPLTPEERAAAREKRASDAAKHIGLVRGVFAKEVAASVEGAILYEDGQARDAALPEPRFESTEVVVQFGSSTDAAFAATDKAAVLDFASYRNPGGGYERGAWAQEEQLCSESTLYPVLDGLRDVFYAPNRDTMRGELYTDRALYVPNIVFMKGSQMATRDVVVCAAPNRERALENHRSVAECDAELERRVAAVMAIGALNEVDTYILGAFGCGVFKNDPAQVAGLFKAWLDAHPGVFERVVFAIPGGRNLDAFRDAFGQPRPERPVRPAREERDEEPEEDDWRKYL